MSFDAFFLPFFYEGPRSRCYGHTAALRVIVQPCFRVMEHRWNEIGRGKPKYSEKNLSQCHLVHQQILHGLGPGFFSPMARQPLGGQGLLIFRGFAITHF